MSVSGPVYRARILGSGSSGGVPRVDGDWGACDPENPKNRRLRCSLLVEYAPSLEALDQGQSTRVLIDTATDLRQQFLNNQIKMIDAIAYTHTHADQAHGIDDVRALVYVRRAQLDAFMSHATADRLLARFGYIFETPKGSGYPPLLNLSVAHPSEEIVVSGEGGDLSLSLFDVEHGQEPCSGVRVGPIAYTPDVNGLNEAAFTALEGTALWIVDALRQTPHPSHAHLEMTLDWLDQVAPQMGILTNLHIDMDYETVNRDTPDTVRAAYDGLSVTLSETGAILRADPV